MVVRELPKLETRVRFSYPAPFDKIGQMNYYSFMVHHSFEISPRFFDQILPEFGERGLLTHRQIAEIQRSLREDGPHQAANVLCSILETAQKENPK